MPEKQKTIEHAIVGLVATAIAVNVLTTELPRVLLYLVILAAVIGLLRLIWWFTQH
jgi:hypothetical protein